MAPVAFTTRRELLATAAGGIAFGVAGCAGDSGGTPSPDESTPEPTDESTPEPTDESTPEPTDEPTPEPTDESTPASTFEREVDPTRTYVRTQSDDAGDARPIDLSSLGVAPGESVRIERLGSFTGSSGGTGMTAVFSSSDALAGADTRERVTDAIDVGVDYETSATYEGSAVTDVPEDFLVADSRGEQTGVTMTVPEGATHLFVAAIDNLYEDNGQGDPPFGVRIEPTPAPTSEREVDPTRTYLRTRDDDAGDARPIDLSSLGVVPGESVRIERLGSFTGSSGGTGMTAVFSSSDALAGADTRERVTDAIDVGTDHETSATYNGNAATDIPADFLVADSRGEQTGVKMTVPEGATHLFVAAIDNLYEDNGQGDPPFGVRVETA